MSFERRVSHFKELKLVTAEIPNYKPPEKTAQWWWKRGET